MKLYMLARTAAATFLVYQQHIPAGILTRNVTEERLPDLGAC